MSSDDDNDQDPPAPVDHMLNALDEVRRAAEQVADEMRSREKLSATEPALFDGRPPEDSN
jgi:hypothetical protein